jgi:hypothetical protein
MTPAAGCIGAVSIVFAMACGGGGDVQDDGGASSDASASDASASDAPAADGANDATIADAMVDSAPPSDAPQEGLFLWQVHCVAPFVEIRAMDMGANGNLAVAGIFSQNVDCGDGMESVPFDDTAAMFVALFGAGGDQKWLKVIGTGEHYLEPFDIAVDANGAVVVAGTFLGTNDFGDGNVTAVGSVRDMYVAKYDGADGTHVWSRTMLGPATDYALAVDTDSTGAVYVGGMFGSMVNFGDGFETANGIDGYVVKYAADDGAHAGFRQLGGPVQEKVKALAVDSNDAVVVWGWFDKDSDFGAGPNPTDSNNNLIKYNSNLTYLWSRGLGSNAQLEGDLAFDADDLVYFSGAFSGTVNLGGDDLVATMNDPFIARYAPANGAHSWSRSFEGPYFDYVTRVAVVDDTTLFAAGTFTNSLDLDTETLTGTTDDLFLAELSVADGTPERVQTHGSDLHDVMVGVAADMGHVVIVGNHRGAIDFGDGLLPAPPTIDGFIVAFGP